MVQLLGIIARERAKETSSQFALSLLQVAFYHEKTIYSMDQISIKIPNPKCRLYWCLIELIDWRYSQSCGILNPSCELAPL
jgi:hypothetical protein